MVSVQPASTFYRLSNSQLVAETVVNWRFPEYEPEQPEGYKVQDEYGQFVASLVAKNVADVYPKAKYDEELEYVIVNPLLIT